jgi:hypothetical protein
MNGFGLFGGGGLSLNFGHSKCPLESGKSVSHGNYAEVGGGDVLEVEGSADFDDDGADFDIPLKFGLGGGLITGNGPSTTTTYATPLPVTAFPNAPDPQGYGSSRPPYSVP